MKKIFMILCMALMSVGAFAEKDDVNVGVSGHYNADSDYSQIGVGAKVQWECLKNIRLEGNAAYFFEKDGCEEIFAGVDAQYLIRLNKKGFNIYPMVGAGYRNSKDYTHINYHYENGVGTTTGSEREWDGSFNLDLGAGIEFPISDRLKINTDCRYFYLDDYPVISVGISLKL
ncbi:MAG: porin family protein [Prevotella sp.]|nr:porin family protein [Prevotella sp.]